MDKSPYYEIRVQGHLDQSLAEWFDTLTLVTLDGGDTLLSGYIPDQAGLHGVLYRISSLGLTLISVNSVDPGE